MNKSLYEILGLKENASQDEIKAAYRRLAHEHHPDKGGNANRFTEISYAYRVLNDPGSRQLYDKEGRTKPPDLEKEIKTILFSALEDALASGQESGILKYIRSYIQRGRSKFTEEKSKALTLQSRLRRIKQNGQPTVFSEIIEWKLKLIKFDLIEIERQLGIADACDKILDNYSETMPWMSDSLVKIRPTFDFNKILNDMYTMTSPPPGKDKE